MPFADEDPLGPVLQMPDRDWSGPGFWRTLGAAFREGNTIVSTLSADPLIADRYRSTDPDFDPFETLEEPYRPHARAFVTANSPDEVARIKAQIDAEQEHLRTLAEAGAGGMAAAIAAGLVDPLQLVPVAGQAGRAFTTLGQVGRLSRMAGGALDVARAGALGAAAAELGLQSSQVTREAAASVENIGAAALFAGVLGGAAPVAGDLWRAFRRGRVPPQAPELAPAPAGAPDAFEPGSLRVAPEPAAAPEPSAPGAPAAPDLAPREPGSTPREAALAAQPEDVAAVDPDTIAVDAKRFQFKAGGDAEGVTDRLRDVKRFDRRLAGVALVWEDRAGQRFIVDGHQRLALAKRLKAEGQADARLNAIVLREADGITAEEARAAAALKNIAEGTGSAIDAAKVLREIERSPALAERVGELPPLPPTSPLVRDGLALARLSDDAFGMVVNEVVPASHAAVVGRRIADVEQQVAALKILAEAKPRSIGEADILVRDVLHAGFVTEAQGSLFGESTFKASLYGERAKILQAAFSRLRRDKAVFRTLVDQEGRITQAGNQLDAAANSRRLTDDERLLLALDRNAHVKGPVSETLDRAARELKGGGRSADVAGRFVDDVRALLRGGLEPGPALDGARPPDQGGPAPAAGLEPDLFAAPAEGGGGFSLSAASPDEGALFERLKKSFGVDRAVALASPLLRLATSPSIKARRYAAELAETPFAYEKNALGQASPIAVETAVKMWRGAFGEAARQMDDAFLRYRGRAAGFGAIARQGIADLAGAAKAHGKLTYGEFRDAVGQAMRRGDRHEIPEVAEAAAAWRARVFDPLKDRAIAADLLPEDVKVETAASYLSRVYNLDRIKAKRPEFVAIAAEWLGENQAVKAGVQSRIRDLDDELDGWEASLRKVERRLATLDRKAVQGEAAGAEAKKGAGDALRRSIELGDRDAAMRAEIRNINLQIRRLELARRRLPAKDQTEILGPREGEAELRDLLARRRELRETIYGRIATNKIRGGEASVARTRTAKRAALLAERLDAVGWKRENLEAYRERLVDIIGTTEMMIGEQVAKWPGRADSVAAILRRPTDLSPAELAEEAEKIADHILGHPGGRSPYEGIPPIHDRDRRGPLLKRAFAIPDERIEPFLESDVETIARIYMNSVAPDVELASRFGDIAMTREVEDLRASYVPLLRAAKTDAERVRLENRRNADVRDLEAMRDRLRGIYKAPADPDSMIVRAGRVARDINYLRLMGGMTLSALPDLARTVMVEGLGRTMGDGVAAMMRNFQAFKLAANETKIAGTALDMVLDTRAQSLADIGDDYGRHSRFERGLRAVTNQYGLVTAMAPWNAAIKQFAGVVVQARMLDVAERWAAGRASAAEIERMAIAGIDEGTASRIADQFKAFGVTEDGVRIANTLFWEDEAAARAFRAALVKDVDRIVVTPGIGDRPLWMSHELGKLVGQFKTFAFASAQRVTLPAIQQRDAAALNGLFLMTMIGMGSYGLRQMIQADGKLSDNPAKWIAEGIDKAGVTGWLFDAHNIIEKLSRGSVGLARITGAPIMDRYASRNVWGALAGPSAGIVEDVTRIAGAIGHGEWNTTDTRAVRRMLPAQNLFYLRWLLDQAEASINEAFGARAPAKRKGRAA